MAWNRLGFPTPPAPDDEPDLQDHRKCPVCGWSPCLPNCRLGLDKWTVDLGLQKLQDGDPIDLSTDECGDFKIEEDADGFLPPSDYVDEGDFE